MRTETVLDIMSDCYRRSRSDWKTLFESAVIGMVVLTDFNNKTYRIHEVDYDKTPNDTFSTREGDVTFVEYYRRKYGKTIHDTEQPLLISMVKARDLRAGRPDFILLVPELCRATGLSENMRNNRK